MTDLYVIDTSVLVQSILEEAETRHVQTLLYMAVQPGDPVQLHIPEFSLIECCNVLWKRVQFHGEKPENAQQMLRDLRAFPLRTYASAGLLPRALEIAIDNRLAVYDCVHIALAQSLGCPLITVDQRQAEAAQGVAVELIPITNVPEYQNGT